MADEVIVKLKVDNSGAVKVIDQTKEAIQETEDSTKNAETAVDQLGNKLDQMTGGAITGFRNMTKAIKTGVSSMKTLKVAIASTGIGLLVIAIGSLVSFFTKTAEGAKELKVISAGLGAVWNEITDLANALGETIFKAFTDPKAAIKAFGQFLTDQIQTRIKASIEAAFNLGQALKLLFEGDFEGAGEKAVDFLESTADFVTGVEDVTKKVSEGIKDTVEEIDQSVEAAIRLERALNNVRSQERELRVERAEARAEIQRDKFIAEDITRTFEERREAAERALSKEQELLDRQLGLAQERLRIEEAQQALSDSSIEDLNRLADLQEQVANLEAQSLEKQITARNLLNQIDREREAEQKRRAEERLAEQERLEQERLDALSKIREAQLTEDEREIFLVKKKYRELIDLAERFNQDTTELEKRRDEELRAIEMKRLDFEKEQKQKEIQLEQDKQDAKLNIVFGALSAIAAVAGEESAFAKAVSVAQATWSTYEAAMNAYASGSKLSPVFGAIAAATAIATGLLQVQKILSTPEPDPPKIPNRGGAGSAAGGRGGGQSSPPLQGSINLINPAQAQDQFSQSIGDQVNGEGAPKSYVVSEDMTDQQALDRRTRSNGTFG